jgi:DNA modification methylase
MLTILQGDALEKLRTLPDESVQCCVTSPPFWGLRDYGTAKWDGGDAECDHRGRSQTSGASTLNEWKNGGGQRYKEETGGMPFALECGKCGARRIDSQLGLEKTPEEYVAKLVAVFQEVRRILRNDGTLWLNLGDSYTAKCSNPHGEIVGCREARDSSRTGGYHMPIPPGLKQKDLVGIPWMVAFALRADGWWLRSDIIWAKPNPMPESVTDRPTKAHEYIFLLTKSARYFYDAEAIKEKGIADHEPGNRSHKGATAYLAGDEKHRTKLGLVAYCEKRRQQRKPAGWDTGEGAHGTIHRNGRALEVEYTPVISTDRNKRSVWRVATSPYPDAHFATYPPDLIKPCVLAGCPQKVCSDCGAVQSPLPSEGTCRQCGSKNFEPGTVLDCFAGSGTTGQVALELGRRAILIELNPKYVELIEERCTTTIGLAL